jgi:predicted permease
MAVGALAQAILGFVAIVVLGIVLRRVGLVERSAARVLNAVIIYVGLPAFVFRAVHGARVGADMIKVVAIAWVVFSAVMVVALVAVRLLRLDERRSGGFLLAAALGNTGYLGYPLTGALLGSAAVPLAVFYDVFGTVVQLVLVGFPISRRLGAKSVKGHRLGVIGEFVTFPALVAAIIALALSRVAIPEAVSGWLGLLANMVAPMIMLSVGISLSPRAIRHGAAALVVLAALKLVLAPVIAAAVGTAFVTGDAYRTAVLEAGMPSMMLSLAIGERFGLDDDFIAAAVFVTTVGAALSVPLAQLLLG